MWHDIEIRGVKPYKSSPREIKPNRVSVTLDMPIKTYSEFRKLVEVHNNPNKKPHHIPTLNVHTKSP
jgi:hypothetical protein